MASARAQEPRTWEPPPDIDLHNKEAVEFWTRKLQVTPSELEEVVERVCLSAHVAEAQHQGA